MESIVRGVVKDGQIVPSVPLPEDAWVEIRLADPPVEVPPELLEEFEAWDRASAHALERVERLARGDEADEAG
jgi:hypothetical protein